MLFLLSAPLLGLYGQPAAPAAGVRRVLFLYSHSRLLPWGLAVIKGIDEALSAYDLKSRPLIYEEAMDSARVGDLADISLFAANLKDKYRKIRLDAVLTESQQAADLLMKYPDLFPGVSRYLFNFYPESVPGPGRGDERMYPSATDLEKAVTTVKYVLPGIRRIIVVNDRSPIGTARTQLINTLKAGWASSFSVEIWDDFTMEELIARASKLPGDSALLYLPVRIDREGRILVPAEVASALAAVSPVPVFSHFDSLLGTGIAGGYLVSGIQLGRLMGNIAALGNPAAPASLAAYSASTMGYYFDSRSLRRWRIPDSSLPPGSVILYREKTFFQRYGVVIFAAAFVVLLETALIAALGRYAVQRKRALALLDAERGLLEQRVRERTAELAREVQERRLSEERERLTAREKEHLLRELQHRVKNSIAVISSLFTLESDRAKHPETQDALSKLGTRIDALAVLYDILYDTKSVETIELSGYLGRVADSAAESLGAEETGITLRKELDCASMGVKNAVALGLIVNELVTDSMKYAFPGGRRGNISVRLERKAAALVLEVSDDGVGLPDGFDPAAARGFGMSLVENLAEQLGAAFTVRSEGGARFRLEFPV